MEHIPHWQERKIKMTNTKGLTIKGQIAKKNLINALKSSKDENGMIDMRQFRNEYPKCYASINRLFGSVDEALRFVGAKRTARTTYRKSNARKSERTNQMYQRSVRDLLALDMIDRFRNEGMSFDKIAEKYGVSREMMSSLYSDLNN